MQDPTASLLLEIRDLGDRFSLTVSRRNGIADTLRECSERQIRPAQLSAIASQIADVLHKSSLTPADPQLLSRLKKLGFLLRESVFTPSIAAALTETPCSSLCLLLDEGLESLPWELVFDGNSFLCQMFNTGRLIRTKSGIRRGRKDGRVLPARMLILANPTGDLPRAYDEGLAIRKQFDADRGRVCVDFKSTRIDYLTVKDRIREYDIVHFAGHCEYDEDDSAQSGWVFADGRLTVSDILSMAAARSFPWLVFSNACRSAAPAAAKPSCWPSACLANAFLSAGVTHYVGSIVPVEDRWGQVFAGEFYGSLFRNKPLGECIRLARLKLMEEPGQSLSWAGYVLYGDPEYSIPSVGRSDTFVKEKRRKPVFSILACAIVFAGLTLSFFRPVQRFSLFQCRRLMDEGRNQEAEILCRKLLTRDPRSEQAWFLRIESLSRQGRTDEAIRSSLQLAESGGLGAASAAAAYLHAGSLCRRKAEYDRSFSYLGMARDLAHGAGDTMTESDVGRELAAWHSDKGERTAALELLTDSLELNRGADRKRTALDYASLGGLYAQRGQPEKAREFYDKAVRLFEAVKFRGPEYFRCRAELCILLSRCREAFELRMKALQVSIGRGDTFALAQDFLLLGESSASLGLDDQAEKFFLQSAENAERCGAVTLQAYGLEHMGTLLEKTGRKSECVGYLRSSENIFCSAGLPSCEAVRLRVRQIEESP